MSEQMWQYAPYMPMGALTAIALVILAGRWFLNRMRQGEAGPPVAAEVRSTTENEEQPQETIVRMEVTKVAGRTTPMRNEEMEERRGAGRTQPAPSMEGPKAWLVVKGKKGRGVSYELLVRETVIGRDEECDIHVADDEKMSRKHAKVIVKPTGAMIYDLGSTNGVFVQGQLVPSKKLHPGDVIRLGNTEFVYTAPEEKSESRTEPGPGKVETPEEEPRTRPRREVTRPMEEEEPSVAWLIVEPKGGKPQTYGLSEATYNLGRSPESDIVLEDPFVSGTHARLVVSEGGAKLYDLASKNGTKVNGRKIEDAAEVKPGDAIMMGKTRLNYAASSGALPTGGTPRTTATS